MVWEIEASGTYKDLHDFGGTVTNANGASGPDGTSPLAGVTFDTAGNMYGTATTGGLYKYGVVWEIETSGTYKDLHDFGGTVTDADGKSGLDGENPTASVTFDRDGNIYGTALEGGPNPAQPEQPFVAYYSSEGMVWEITMSGVYRDLHDFGATVTIANGTSGSDGFTPRGAVTVDSSGNLYGTTQYGGQYDTLPGGGGFAPGGGIAWEITASGDFEDLYDLGGSGGYTPSAGVTLDSAGNIYGTTQGSYDDDAPVGGLVWKLAPASTTLPAPSIAANGIVPVGSGSAIAASISPAESPLGSVTPGEWLPINGSNLATSTVSWIGTSPNLAIASMSWTGNFPTFLGGTSVTINGIGAFLSFVSPTQIVLQVPNDITSTSACCVNPAIGTVSLGGNNRERNGYFCCIADSVCRAVVSSAR